MSDFHIKNDKGLFGNVQNPGLMSVQGVEYLEKMAKDPPAETPAKFSQKELAQILSDLSVVKALNVEERYCMFLKNDAPQLKKAANTKSYSYGYGYGVGTAPFYCLPSVSGVSVTANIHSYKKEMPMGHFLKDLEQGEKIQKRALLERFAAFHNVTFDKATFDANLRTRKRLEKGEYIVEERHPEIEFGETKDACMIFVANKDGGGYLSTKDNYVSLGSARLFESSGAAQRAINAKGYAGQAVIIQTKIQIQKIIASENFSGDISRVQASINMIEKKNLMDALEGATVEQLKERLAKYEDVSLLDAKGPAKKRAM